MPAPGEHKTVQARILAYAQEIGWTYVPRAEAEGRRDFDLDAVTPEDRARTASLYFGGPLYSKICEFNPKYKETEGALVGELQRLHADIAGNRDLLAYLRNQGKFFCAGESRELDLTVIDYGDLARPREEWRNVYEVTEEFYVHNGHYGTREDVVFLINGIPVLVIECKNATKDEAIALGVDQIRRYHTETPEVMVPEMIFTATEAIGFAYGVTWNTIRRNLLNWKHQEVGNLESKIKTFCAVPNMLRFLKDFILFVEKDEELQKIILRPHQTAAVDKVVERSLDARRSRGLVWHTQGSGKTYTMIKAAELLFKAPQAEKPTILLMIDRNELEDQMLKNLAAVGLGNVAHADRIAKLNSLLDAKGQDYRGIVVTMIHKFRKNFTKVGEKPKILIVTEKLLTGFDAPILYAMYLDKPMRDHTLLQAIARVNRPYENEAAEMVKPHGFVLDFVGIFDKLEKALAFDSDEVNAIVKDLNLLKQVFKAKMESKAPAYLALVTQSFNDKDVDNLIEHFRDKERRKEFFKEFKEIEMLYEIISPDAFLRPFIENYTTLASIYAVVRNAYSKEVYVDRAFQKKTNELVQKHIGTVMDGKPASGYALIDKPTIERIKAIDAGKATKVINLVKSIERSAEENSNDPFLVSLSERARAVQESFEDRQTTTEDALAKLLREIEKDEQRKRDQAARGLDSLTYFVLCKLTEDGIPNPEIVSKKVAQAFTKFPNWQRSEAELRELRKKVTFALFAEEDDLTRVTATVEALFNLLQKSFRS